MKYQEFARPLHRSPLFTARGLSLAFGLLLMVWLALPAWAAEAEDAVDPPDRVGRIADLKGQVWIFAPESGEWITAARNRPLTTGDRLSTDRDGRAELRVGSSTVVRIDASTELEVLKLDDEHVTLQVHSGSLSARLRSREAAREFSVVTDEGRFQPETTGSYRVDRFDDTSHATAWAGQIRFEGEGLGQTVVPGKRAEFWRESNETKSTLGDPQRDEFSDWVADSDKRDERSASTRYVSSEMTGVEDLDRYGRWEETPDYGPIWIPAAVAVGWAPYQAGHWGWVAPWGWTWIDDAPWGFAPFHYGRWVNYRSAWCWTPGTYVRRPVYAPAMVAWIGGPHVGVSVSIGGPIGWFPLAPHEIYVPGYRTSPRYIRSVNVTHVTNISNVNVTNIINKPGDFVGRSHYRNRDVPHAVTVVPGSALQHREPVGSAQRRVDDRTRNEMMREKPRAQAPVQRPEAPRAPGGGTRRAEDGRGGRDVAVSNPRVPVPPSPAAQAGGGRNNGRNNDHDNDRGGDRDGNRNGNRRDVAGAPAAPPVRTPTPSAPVTGSPRPGPQSPSTAAAPQRGQPDAQILPVPVPNRGDRDRNAPRQVNDERHTPPPVGSTPPRSPNPTAPVLGSTPPSHDGAGGQRGQRDRPVQPIPERRAAPPQANDERYRPPPVGSPPPQVAVPRPPAPVVAAPRPVPVPRAPEVAQPPVLRMPEVRTAPPEARQPRQGDDRGGDRGGQRGGDGGGNDRGGGNNRGGGNDRGGNWQR